MLAGIRRLPQPAAAGRRWLINTQKEKRLTNGRPKAAADKHQKENAATVTAAAGRRLLINTIHRKLFWVP